jgi:hypothetical protein
VIDGVLLPPQIISQGVTVSSDILERLQDGASVTAQPKGFQTDESFLEEIKRVAPFNWWYTRRASLIGS